MVDKNYKQIGTPAMRIMEECGEVINAAGSILQALGKGERFGWLNSHPARPGATNYSDLTDSLNNLEGEVKDLFGAAKDLEKMLWSKGP
ncbi:MAG: hypothetical protein HY835_10325 [Anaerolineae bacterium]|nr:hypothetical protein [Anaerolineae bacterium]